MKQNEFVGIAATARELGEVHKLLLKVDLPYEIRSLIQEQLLIRQSKATAIMNGFKTQFFVESSTEIKVFFKINSLHQRFLESPLDFEDFLVSLESLGTIDDFLGEVCNKIIKTWVPKLADAVLATCKKTGTYYGFIIDPSTKNEDCLQKNTRIVQNFTELAKFVSCTLFKQCVPPDLFLKNWSAAIAKSLENIFCQS